MCNSLSCPIFHEHKQRGGVDSRRTFPPRSHISSSISNCAQLYRFSRLQDNMKFVDWYVKIGLVSAMIGASMELFMIKTGFYDKVTVLESEKRAWESSPEALAVKEALNPWRQKDSNVKENA